MDNPERGLKEMPESVELSRLIDEVLERCAALVESGHTAHDLHEIAATIRGWKEKSE